MKPNPRLLSLALLALGAAFALVRPAEACSRAYPFRLSELFGADVIVRATAVRYVTPPEPNTRTTGIPDSTVEFRVEEVIWGTDVPESLVIHGYLTDHDDFNEVPLPYRFVRPGGRAGSCFANSYRQGAQFLLFMRRSYQQVPPYYPGIFTPYWSALGPTNEQLRGANDPWIKWVRAYLSPCARQGVDSGDYSEMSRARMEALEGRAEQGGELERYRFAKCYVSRFGAESERARRYARIIDSYETIRVGR